MINSNNEWSPLKEVIVGSGFSYQLPMLDLSFKLFYHDNAHLFYNDSMIITSKTIKELNEDIEMFVKALENENIKVYRPKEISRISKIKSPVWETANLPALNVRDQAIILGNTILETPPMVRARYFENDLLKPIFYEKFKEGAKWIQMPKPIMSDESFDQSYVTDNKNIEDATGYPSVKNNYDIGHEMLIDAAQMVRFNRDIIINVANRNHLLGYEWLIRHFPEYNFHKVHSIADNHLDSYIVPLDEGTLLLRNKSYIKQLPKFLKDWNFIFPPKLTENMFPKYKNAENFNLASPYIDMNVLSIGNNKIIANSLMEPILELLDSNGFNVIPVQHRHRRIFGGGFHCFTLDLLRENK